MQDEILVRDNLFGLLKANSSPDDKWIGSGKSRKLRIGKKKFIVTISVKREKS